MMEQVNVLTKLCRLVLLCCCEVIVDQYTY
ncbi:hypothetical protein RND81_11G071300 [Saponaria officinalis]|uniref:Uncharacterized protein n=1 Tax=Saponaria officinalis TaxID=3572 RepID=A0AAW1HHX2_SAPOF